MNRLRLLLVLVFVVIAGIAVFDGLSPRQRRNELQGTAGAAASRAADEYFTTTGDATKAKVAAVTVASADGAVVSDFQITAGGGVKVTVSDQARSILAGHLGIKKLTDRTQVSATAFVGPRIGERPVTTTTAAP